MQSAMSAIQFQRRDQYKIKNPKDLKLKSTPFVPPFLHTEE